MSQASTARAPPPPSLHDPPTFGGLQPSALPRPPPSPAPRTTTNLNMNTAARKIDLVPGTGAGSKPHPQPQTRDGAGSRTVLGRVNVNANSASNSAAALQKRVAARPQIPVKAKVQIPRPAAAPDVFAPDPPKLGKRARTDQTPAAATTAKRPRADASTVKALRYEQEQWAAKWLKAFPTLTFHFEIGTEDGAGRGLRARVTKLGAKIDQFFSQRVSHLIVKTAASPRKPRASVRRGQSDNPFLDQTTPTDLVLKAEKLGIKVWTVKKLNEMLDQLDPVVEVGERDTLSNMLADEKLHGTRERDQTAPRPDYYYFRPGRKYVLIEDATGRNRTVMVKEYTAKEQDWPVLHEQFLRLTSSCALPRSIKNTDHLHRDLRARAMALYVNQEPFHGEEPPAPTLKRSSSMREFPIAPMPHELPYVKASGNSVVLTSNIASTSTANNNATPGMVQHPAGKRGALQVSKRVEVLKRNMPSRDMGSAEKRIDSVARLPGIGRRKSLDSSSSSGSSSGFAAAKEFLSQAQVVTMLRQIRAPTNMTKPTYDERVANREMVDAGHKRKEQDTASGYCENCRIRYTDLSVHMASRKHRRFAQNRKNFADLDDMLHCLQRPPNPIMCVQTKVCRPCTRAHTKDAECGRCMDDPQLYSSPPPSTPGSATKQHMFGSYDFGASDEEDEVMSEGEGEGEGEGDGGEEEVVEGMNDEAAEAADGHVE